MNNDLMTLSEYAEIKGCTVRAVYGRISRGSLDGYLVISDGKKMLLRQLLNKNYPEGEYEHTQLLYAILQEMKTINERLERIERMQEENPCKSTVNQSQALDEPTENTGKKRFLGLFRK